MLSDPIVALATPPGRSALAVIRLSGRGAFEVAARVIPSFRTDPTRTAHLASFRDAQGELLDRGLYLVFPAPRSETGEDVVEFQCHGGHAVPTRLLRAIEAAGGRPARRGEFTRRAVQNGKLDLLQAEGLGDLIDAEVPAQVRVALGQFEGRLSREVAGLRAALVDLLALLTYEIDFPDEDDGPIPGERLEEARARVAGGITRLLQTAPRAERIRVGALVVLAGPPNVGKSSLFNALLGADRALVSELPGTTRDAIEAPADFGGWPVRLVDTAGLGEALDRIDAMGQAMGRQYLERADLVILCDDGTGAGPAPEMTSERLLPVGTKGDLDGERHGLRVSALTGLGIDQLRETIVARLFQGDARQADLEPALTRERHRAALTEAARAVDDSAQHLVRGGDVALAAHDLQAAVAALEGLLGSVDIEEILDRLFTTFCVGK